MKGVNKGQFKNPMPHYEHVLNSKENEYMGGCSVHRGDTMSTSGGYHEYIGGIS